MCCTCQQTTRSLSSLPHPLCVVPVNRPHIACHLYHILCVVPVSRPHIACHLYHILCVLYLSTTTHNLSSLSHPLCVVPVNRPHIAYHLYHILCVLYLSADHTQPVISITSSVCCTCQQTTYSQPVITITSSLNCLSSKISTHPATSEIKPLGFPGKTAWYIHILSLPLCGTESKGT